MALFNKPIWGILRDMKLTQTSLVGLIGGFASRLRFPYLFFVTAALFLIDLVIPDFIPLADEILFGLATILLGSWKKRRHQGLEGDPDADDLPTMPS